MKIIRNLVSFGFMVNSDLSHECLVCFTLTCNIRIIIDSKTYIKGIVSDEISEK